MGLFEDPEFPPENKSLYMNWQAPEKAPNYVKGCRWLRPSQICKGQTPKLFPDTPPQVMQGALGDCWFLSALSVITSRKNILADLFRNNPTGLNINPEGKYIITFYYDQVWTDVVIDDQIPCNADGSIAYSKAKAPNAFWVPLIEKAYAKLHGKCYEHLEGGVSSQGLANLCGYVGVKIYFSDFKDLFDDSEEKARMMTKGELGKLEFPRDEQIFKDWTWKRFSTASAFGALFCTGKSDAESGVEEATDTGLLANHAYGILRLKEVDGHRLVQMRNPWGKVEWNGKWSDKSSAWTPELKEEAGWKDADDGIFFMDWDDFHKEFPGIFEQSVPMTPEMLEELKIDIKHNKTLRDFVEELGGIDKIASSPPPKPYRVSFKLMGDSAGGCMNYASWRHNPQIAIRNKSKSHLTVRIQVCQKDMRYTGRPDYDESLGFMVIKGTEFTKHWATRACPRVMRVMDKDAIRFKSRFQYARYATRTLSLEPYEGVYYVIGWMFHSSDDTTLFNINVLPLTLNPDDCEVCPVLRDYCYKIEDEFVGTKAGGCPKFPTWVNNPQYLIKPILGKARVRFVMVPGDIKSAIKDIQPQSMGLCVFEDKERKRKVEKWGPILNEMPDYAFNKELVVKGIDLGNEMYILMPQAYKPEFQFKFQLYLYSSGPLRVQQAKSTELWLCPAMEDNGKALRALMAFTGTLLSKSKSVREMQRNVKLHFQAFDKSGDNKLSREEFATALKEYSGGSLSEKEVDNVFDMVDEDCSGFIDVTEFTNALMNCCEI